MAWHKPMTPQAVLDTNILLLWLATKSSLPLWNWDKIQMFDVEDGSLLSRLLTQFRSLATTPHVLTEASNLANQLHGPQRDAFFAQLGAYATQTTELHRPSSSLAVQPKFAKFGITDCALCDVGPESTVITTDHKLAGHLDSLGRNVLNFTHFRQSRLFS